MCRGTRCTHHFNPVIKELEKDYSYDLVMLPWLEGRERGRAARNPENFNMYIGPMFKIKDDADCEELHDTSLKHPCHWLEVLPEVARRKIRAQLQEELLAWGIPQMEISPTDQSWKVTRL